MKYIVKRKMSMPTALKNKFASYEQARQAVRKWLRKAKGVKGNATLRDFGFSVEKA